MKLTRSIVGLTAAVALSVGLTAGPAAGTATDKVVDSDCAVEGVITISPPLSAKPEPVAFTIESGDAYASSNDDCTLAPSGTQAMLSGSFHSPAASCDPKTNELLGEPASGKLQVTWPDATTSTVKLNLVGRPTRLDDAVRVSGKVRDGVDAGDSAHGRYLFGLRGTSICRSGSSGTSIGFGQVGSQLSTLQFTH